MPNSSRGSLQPITAVDLLPAVDKKHVQRITKRTIDFIISSFALLILLPLLVIVAIAIKLTSRGPVFFSQTRVGHKGKKFKIYKFRTMVEDAESQKLLLLKHNEKTDGVTFKMKNDPRITKIGGFLRKHAIDELPQLWNIVNGEMSIVGPRPHVVSETTHYKGWHKRRLDVKPGLTCYWQVDDEQYTMSFDDWMQLDLKYIDNWTIKTDFHLILRTIPVVFTGKGRS